MDPSPASPWVDARKVRFEQSLVAVALLAGFVFKATWVIPLAAVVTAFGAAFGAAYHPLHLVFEALLTPRLPPCLHRDDPAEVRFGLVAAAAVLTLATAALVTGLGGLAWILALVDAGVGAVAATTGASLPTHLHHRHQRRQDG